MLMTLKKSKAQYGFFFVHNSNDKKTGLAGVPIDSAAHKKSWPMPFPMLCLAEAAKRSFDGEVT